MAKPIESITLNNFKGAAGTLQIDLDKNKPIVLIYGENGTGKSTILDSLDFVSNERFGSIMERSVGKSVADYMPTIGTNKSLLEVAITTSDGTWIGKIGTKANPAISGPATNRPKVEILRRSRILSIVTAQPKERYGAIKEFVEVPACEANEKSVRDAEKQKMKEYEDAVKALQEAESTLKSLWEKEGKPDSSPIEWAKKAVRMDHSQLDAQLKEIESILLDIANCSTACQGVVTAKADLETAARGHQDSLQALERAQDKTKEDVSSLIEVLTQTQSYLQKHKSATVCPVCEQTIAAETLSANIQRRLTANNEVVVAQRKVQAAKTTTDGKEVILKSKQKDFRNAVIVLKNKSQSSTIGLIQDIKIEYSQFTKLTDISIEVDEDSLNQAEQFYQIMNGVRTNLTLQKQKLNDSKGKHFALKNHVDTIQSKTSTAKKLEKLVAVLSQVRKIVEDERKSFVDQILANITGDIEAMYTTVHPYENIGKIRWYLNPNYQGSLEFEGEFQGAVNIPPPAYYSESHLDTLGVCVFIALTKYNKCENTIMVLDDVVTSVDQVHMERFFRMLNDQADQFSQIIIGTHYRPWRDKYRYYTKASSKVQLIELQSWTLAKGIRHAKTKFCIEELREVIAATPFDRQVVASKAGILLEGVLDRLGRQFQCRMPMKADPDYTLGEFTGGFSSSLKKLLRIERMKSDGTTENIELAKKLEACTDYSWVRNQVGCHFSTTGMTISDADVLDFGNKVIEFASSVICNDCGEFSQKNKSGSNWECRCGKTKLFPLLTP